MRKHTSTPAAVQTPAAIPIIQPLGVYTPEQARAVLGLARTTIKAERRAGRLRVGKRGNRYFIMGSWLLEWLEAGELPSRGPSKRVESDMGIPISAKEG